MQEKLKRFRDFAEDSLPLEGDKISVSELLNREIVVLNYRLSPSKKREGTVYITLQIELEGKKYVAFTGSSVLVAQAEKYKAHFPFVAMIKKINDFYTFT